MKSVKRKSGGIKIEKLVEESLCRLCLKLSNSTLMTNIFHNDTKKQLNLRIMACTSLEVTPDDSLPNQICPTCTDFLELFYAFRKKCKSSDLKYRRFLRLQSSGKITNVTDLSDDEDDEEYSEVLMKFMNKQEDVMDEKLEKAKEEIARKYEEDMMVIVQEEKRRIYREEKQKIQENAMREIVSTLKQKEKDERKKNKPSASKMLMGSGKVFKIVKKDLEENSVEYEVVLGEEEEDTSDKKDDHSNPEIHYTVISEEEYEAEENANDDASIIEQKDDENEQGDFREIFKSSEIEVVEDLHYLEEDKEELEDQIEMVEDEQDGHETPTSSNFPMKSPNESQSMEIEMDTDKIFYLEIESEQGNKPKYYDANGDLLIFKCSMCPKTFPRAKGLEKHEMSHKKRKGYSCTYCDKWFPSNSSRQRHERIHTGEKPFTCGICGRKFVQKEILKRHLIVHSNDKPFKCHQCDKEFTQKEILRQHVNRNHSKNPVVEVHQCFLCPKTFCHASGLSRHLLVHAGRTFPCNVCGKEFVDKSALKRHINTIHKDTE